MTTLATWILVMYLDGSRIVVDKYVSAIECNRAAEIKNSEGGKRYWCAYSENAKKGE
jgi:hypothetical protein